MLPDGRVAVVTGGGSGIGRATATRFASEGFRVAIADVSAAHANSVASSIRESGGEVLVVETDVASASACAELAEATIAAWGRIDVLVASAGIQPAGGVIEATAAEWDSVLDVNLKGVAFSCRAVLPHMVARHSGAIVLISSINAIAGTGHMAAYDASKAGVVALVRSIAIAHGRDGIRANAVAPGATITEFHLRAAAARGATADDLRELDYGLLGRPAN